MWACLADDGGLRAPAWLWYRVGSDGGSDGGSGDTSNTGVVRAINRRVSAVLWRWGRVPGARIVEK